MVRWRVILCWASVVPAAIWALFRVAGWDTWYPATQLMAFTPYVAAFSLLPLALTVLLRRWDAAIGAWVVAAVLAACVLPRAVADGKPGEGTQLRVLTANVLAGGADIEALRRIIREERVDIVALQEVTPRFAEKAGDLLPYKVIYPAPGVGGSAIYSRYPLRDRGVRRTLWFGEAMAEVIPLRVEVESVHTVAPSEPSRIAAWRESFAKEPKATLDGPIRILAGDFNATLDHSLMRELIASGYRDAADATGTGLAGTWGPYDGDLIPPVTLDRVLVDKRAGVVGAKVFGLPNSDHRAVLAVVSIR